jgi:hypothetical protein
MREREKAMRAAKNNKDTNKKKQFLFGSRQGRSLEGGALYTT